MLIITKETCPSSKQVSAYGGQPGQYGNRDARYHDAYGNYGIGDESVGGIGGIGGVSELYVQPAYPDSESQPGMSDDSNALYNSYLRSNNGY